MTQETALGILKTGASVFLTGSAGTGKTYVINQYVDFLKRANIPYAVTASTGIAATHIGGMTIHSWSGLGIKTTLHPYDIDAIESKQYLHKRLTQTQVLIIDEVSMLPQNQLSMIDTLLRAVRKIDAPFGGMQIVLCGDFFQLPPVIKSREVTEADFIFSSPSWKELDPVICYLTTQYRQQEGDLLSILDAVRLGDFDDTLYTLLESRKDVVHALPFTRLYTHTEDVDMENIRELEKLETREESYTMTSHGKDALVVGLIKNCLAPEVLRLRIGARVMFVKNMPEHGFMNGTLGEVIDFTMDKSPMVRLENNKVVTVSPAEWVIEEDGKIRASINQLPLRLAWAITIHKSQGMNLDRAEIDLSKAFTFGQGYVALSRLRTFEGLSLSGFSPRALLVHPSVREYDTTLKELSDLASRAFSMMTEDEQEVRQKNFVSRIGGTWPTSEKDTPSSKKSTRKKNLHTARSTYEETASLIPLVSTLEELAEERGISLGTVIKHLEVLKEQGELPFLGHLGLVDGERLEIIKTVFTDLKTDKLTPVLEYLTKADFETTYDEIRLARLFLPS